MRIKPHTDTDVCNEPEGPKINERYQPTRTCAIMQPCKTLHFSALTSWLGCCVISSVSAAIIVNPVFLWSSNDSRGLFPKNWESTGRRSHNLSLDSSEAAFTAYNIRPTHNTTSYVFGYDNAKDPSGDEHFRFEQRFTNGTVIGEYGYTDYRNSAIVTVAYVADENGYRPNINIRRLRLLG